MSPNSVCATGVLQEDDPEVFADAVPEEVIKPDDRKVQLIWRNIAFFAILHLSALYGLWLAVTSARFQTSVFAFCVHHLAGFGVTMGAHRLWAHRAYKANLPLRLMLLFLQTLAAEGPVINWARDHRVHHKFSETDADPHNARRGFFFSHVGWLMCRKHPQVKEKGRHIDLSDLWADPVLRFQQKYYYFLMLPVSFVMPTMVPMYFWNETLENAFFVNLLKYTITLNITWLVNSAAHLWGQRPYDRFINPADNVWVAVLSYGEGWHNFHHTFPWDYKASELGPYYFNYGAQLIEYCARIGWAYDLKAVSPEVVRKRVLRTGNDEHWIWGWGDRDQRKEE